jgi:hypothetical protein
MPALDYDPPAYGLSHSWDHKYVPPNPGILAPFPPD